MTTTEAARELGVSDRRMRALLEGGRVVGARQRGDGRWEIRPNFKVRAFSSKCKTYGRGSVKFEHCSRRLPEERQ